MQKEINIQYGCGTCSPEGWINFDSSPTIRLQRLPLIGSLFRRGRFPDFPASIRIGNVARGLPVESNSADRLYCAHVLEHLSLEEFRCTLKESYRILKPGAVFRFCLPDLAYYIQEYVDSKGPDSAPRFMEQTLLGHKDRPSGFEGLLRTWLGGAKHLWMWDFPSIKSELEQVGFMEVRRAQFGDSGDPVFAVVESEGRWGFNLGVECRK